jgi:hypothetical protein
MVLGNFNSCRPGGRRKRAYGLRTSNPASGSSESCGLALLHKYRVQTYTSTTLWPRTWKACSGLVGLGSSIGISRHMTQSVTADPKAVWASSRHLSHICICANKATPLYKKPLLQSLLGRGPSPVKQSYRCGNSSFCSDAARGPPRVLVVSSFREDDVGGLQLGRLDLDDAAQSSKISAGRDTTHANQKAAYLSPRKILRSAMGSTAAPSLRQIIARKVQRYKTILPQSGRPRARNLGWCRPDGADEEDK